MSAPFNSWQLKFFRAFAEAMFDGFEDRAISLDRIVDNFVRIFELVKGPPRQRIRFALTWGWVLLGSNFHKETIPERRQKIEARLMNAGGDTLQDFARLKALTYAAYYGHWLPGDEDGNLANPVLAQIGFKLPKARHRDSKEPQLIPRPDVEISEAHVLLPSQVQPEYDYVVRERQPHYAERRMWWKHRHYRSYRRVLLPFTNGGDGCALIMNVAAFV